MKNFKIKNVARFFLASFFVIFGIVFIFNIITGLFDIKINHYRINNIFFVRHGTEFDLIEQPFYFPECEFVPWGGCFINNILFNEKYIQEAENEHSGSGCNGTIKYRFKGIKRGYTKINTEGGCDLDKTYGILIY